MTLDYKGFLKAHRQRCLSVLWVALCLGLTSVAVAQRPIYDLPSDGPNPDDYSISEALDLALDSALTVYDTRYIARKAGDSYDAQYIPQLKQMVILYQRYYLDITYIALRSLFELGEPRSYFLAMAQDWEQNADLAYYAIRTLACDPIPSELPLMDAIDAASLEAHVNVWSAVRRYYSVLYSIQEFEAEPLLRSKAELLFDNITAGLSHIIWVEDSLNFNKESLDGNLSPQAVWGRRALRGITQQYPDSVRAYLPTLKAEIEQKYGPERGPIIARDFGDYVEQEVFRPGPVWLPTPVLPDLPGTLTLVSGTVTSTFQGTAFRLSGLDHTLAGQPTGSPPSVHGILTTSATTRQSLRSALSSTQRPLVTGTDPAPDIAVGALTFEPEELLDLLLPKVTHTLGRSPGGTFGSAETPVIAHAPDGIRLRRNLTGTGVLIVEGPLWQCEADDDNPFSLNWTGLVVVLEDANRSSLPPPNGDDEECRDDQGNPPASGPIPPSFRVHRSKFFGGVLLYHQRAAPVVLSLEEKAILRYSHAAFEMLRTKLLLTP